MPRYLTLGALALALWVVVLSDKFLTGALPGAIVLGVTLGDYRLWTHRDRPWHDWHVIVLLLPAIAAALWIAVGGLATDVERTNAERLTFEVGPGVALVGLLCTLISYHGRHHPPEQPD